MATSCKTTQLDAVGTASLHKTIHVYRVQKGFLPGATRVAASNPARRATNPNGNRWPGSLLLREHGSDSEISWRPRFRMSKIVLGPCRLPCLANGVAGKRAARKFYHGTGVRGGARCRRGGWFFFWHLTQTEYAIFVNSTQECTDSMAAWCQSTWLGFCWLTSRGRVRILRGTPWVQSQVPNSCVPSQIHFNSEIIAEEPWQDGLKTCSGCPTLELKYSRLSRGKEAAVVPWLVPWLVSQRLDMKTKITYSSTWRRGIHTA